MVDGPVALASRSSRVGVLRVTLVHARHVFGDRGVPMRG